jgi:glycine/D-amino acid oxidase-like deaminating enzyme
LMPRLYLAQPLWLDQAPRARVFPRLTTTLRVDVAVVGGGMTGVLVAWMFARSGLRVGLLERARIGRGSTAASTALLMQEPDRDFAELSDKYGRPRARRIWKLSRHSTRHLIQTLQELKISCALARRQSIYYAAPGEPAGMLRREFLRRKSAGLGGAWLGPDALRRATGIKGAGAIRTTGDAQADPYRACLGLARAAQREGAHLFERSGATRIDAGARGVTITTSRGRMHADQVVMATGYLTPFFKPLAANFSLKNTYVVATHPIATRERRTIGLQNDVMMWDTSRPYHYARWTRDHRLLFGGGDQPYVTGSRRARAFRVGIQSLREHLERLWPSVARIDTDYAWEGVFATTPDGLPYIGPHPRYPRHLFALGYGGNGMTFGFLAARLLLKWYRGERSSDCKLFAFDR